MFASRPKAGFLGLDRAIPRMVGEGDFPDRDAALRAIAAYERFYLLAAGRPEFPLAPSLEVDRVWRRHLLDTPAYAEDCARRAGRFLHRADGSPTGAFERARAVLRADDDALWRRPGPAHVPAALAASSAAGGPRIPIEAEDLSAVQARTRDALEHADPASPWVAEVRALLMADPDLALREYRRFLRLAIAARHRVAPSRLVDELWHQHILDTRSYAQFCDRVAGRFVHHLPNYARPRAAHRPTFLRTLAMYRRGEGVEPPERVWAHQGESEGGGCGHCGASSPPPPLYEVDNPWQMHARLSLGRVDARHRGRLHPVLVKKGVPRALWDDLIRAVERTPRIGWEEFASLRGNAPGPWLAAPPAVALGVAALATATGARPGEMGAGVILSAMIAGLVLLFGYAGRWGNRAFDGPSADAIVARFAPEFAKLGVMLEYAPGSAAVEVEAYFTESQMLAWELADRMRRDREAEERQRESEEARAARERDRLASEKRRLRRKAERDAYYLERGIKPGPLAWFRALSDWEQAILAGLAVALPLAAVLGLLLAALRP